MTQATQTPSLIALPPEVLCFAGEQGVTAYLQAVLDLTRAVFPERPVAMYVDEDPEIANDRHIVFDVDVTGMDAEQMFACRERGFASFSSIVPRPTFVYSGWPWRDARRALMIHRPNEQVVFRGDGA